MSKNNGRHPTDDQPITQEEALKSKLIAKFGAELMRDGFIAIPRLLKKRSCELGITPAQYVFWETVISFQYGEELPYPSIARIADEMGRSERSIKRYIRTMEQRDLVRVERSNTREDAGIASNRYDFTGLYEAILALDKSQTETPKSGMKPLKSTTTGDILSPPPHQNVSQNASQNAPQNGHFMPKMPPNLAAKMAVEEDESQEESSQIDSSKIRSASAQSEEGGGLNGSSTPSNQASKDTENKNKNSNNTSTKQRNPKTESVAPTEAAAAPPAWSDVPTREAGSETKPPELPLYAAQVMAGISQQFNDLAPRSSLTAAARMYQELLEFRGVDEYTFGDLAGYAKSDANKANIKKRNPDGSINRMPYFFTMLRKVVDHNIAIWREEEEDRRRAAEEAGKSGGESGGGE